MGLKQPSTPDPLRFPCQTQATDPSSLLTPDSKSLHIHAGPIPSHIYALPPPASKQFPAFFPLAQGKQNPYAYRAFWSQVPATSLPILHCLQRLQTLRVCLKSCCAEHQGAQAIGLLSIPRAPLSFPSLEGEGSLAGAFPRQAEDKASLRPMVEYTATSCPSGYSPS